MAKKNINWGKLLSVFKNYGEPFGSVAAVVISIIALVFSCTANNRQTSLALEGKQADAMTALVLDISMHPYSVAYHYGKDGGVHTTNKSLFEMSYALSDSAMDNAEILFVEGERRPINFEDYVNNPLIPKDIADILQRYCSYWTGWTHENDIKGQSYIILGDMSSKQDKSDSLNETNVKNSNRSLYTLRKSTAYYNWRSFKKTNLELKRAIIKWFADRHININLRDKDFEYDD